MAPFEETLVVADGKEVAAPAVCLQYLIFQCFKEIGPDRVYRDAGFGLPEFDEQFLDGVFQLAGIINKFTPIAEEAFIMLAEKGCECVPIPFAEGFP